MRKFGAIVLWCVVATFVCSSAVYAKPASIVFLKSEAGGMLYKVIPPGGEDKDSLLMLRLTGDSYSRGYQHGALLADRIADVIGDRYACGVFTQEVLAWGRMVYEKMPRDFQDEISGIAKGVSSKGYRFPFEKIILHAAQPLLNQDSFPWFVCPWQEDSGPTGSFSYAVGGRYTPSGSALSINSPDWGAVPKSLARNRVLVSARPSFGFRYAYLGTAGVVGMPGVNETGLSLAGTAGLRQVTASIATPWNGIPIQDGFMSPFMIAAHVLRTMSGSDAGILAQFEDVLRANPVDGFILQISTPFSSALWESGASTSPDYPSNSRRMAGAWDSGNIVPIDWRGDLLLLPDAVLQISALPFDAKVYFSDSNGEPYAGSAWRNGIEMKWQRMQLGRAYALPSDPQRAEMFAKWFANLGIAPTTAPFAIREYANGVSAHLVSVFPDKTGGNWVLADGSNYGSWRRDGSSFRAFGSDGAQICVGPLYDLGNGVAGWCSLSLNEDVEWVAWTYQYSDGAFERLDGMNLSVLPAVRPLAQVHKWIWGGPHSRTHFLMRELGAPKGTVTLDELYKIFQRAYLATESQDFPFGVGAFDLSSGDALFTVSRYEKERYVGGLNLRQKPIRLLRSQLFGW